MWFGADGESPTRSSCNPAALTHVSEPPSNTVWRFWKQFQESQLKFHLRTNRWRVFCSPLQVLSQSRRLFFSPAIKALALFGRHVWTTAQSWHGDEALEVWEWHYCGHKAQQETTLKRKSALGIGFHFRNRGRRRARVLDVLNRCTLSKKADSDCIQREIWEGQNFAAPSLRPRTNAALVFSLLLLSVAGLTRIVMQIRSCQCIQASTTSFLFVFFAKVKCCYQSDVLLAVWELISLSPKLHLCQLTGLLKMTRFLTVPRQWQCSSEIPSRVYLHAKAISIISFFDKFVTPHLSI